MLNKEDYVLVDFSTFDEAEREQFIEGWNRAGGYTGDKDSPSPWCCPWEYQRKLVELPCPLGVEPTPMYLGIVYARVMYDEIAAALAAEEEAYE